MNKLIFIFILSSVLTISTAQSRWEIYCGVGYSNIIEYRGTSQLVKIIPFSSPNFRVTFHGGINYTLFRNRFIDFKTGIGYFQRGSLDYLTLGYGPQDPILAPEMDYIRMPMNANYRLMEGKEFYFSGSLTPGLMVRNYSKEHFGEAFTYPYFFQLDYELGFCFPLYKKIHGKLNYTKGLIPVYNPDVGNGYRLPPIPDGVINNLNISFDLSIIYKI